MAVKPVSASRELSEGEFEMKAMGMIEDYLNIRDIEEVIMCLNELNSPSLMHVVVRAAMNCTLEKNQQARYSVGMLFHKLLKAGHLTKAKFVDGFKEVLMYADDMVLEIPRIWRHLGEMIGATFRDNSLSLKLLADMMEPVRAVDKAGDLMAEILRTAVKLNGADAVGEMWQSSGFTWDMFLPIGVDVKEFVNRKKLDFTVSVSASPELSRRHSSEEPKKVIQPVLQTIKLSTAGENALMPDEDMPSGDKEAIRPNQWSPMNPQVRKQYTRDFLLQFRQYCIDKPEGLPHIPDIVLDKADIRPPRSFDPPGYSRGGTDFIPEYLMSPRSGPDY
ncbi:eukaryotic translation initiation factor 4 gamma 1-like [Patiria miniata]|uniref:MI domain-containing protein n=1 Tax=Patiria miniata TaxID=46514 RepID=A0A914BGN3_PATMI|nr:eukaryotic translation initiation factor 4 gamma 1-like [Patiria miniata]